MLIFIFRHLFKKKDEEQVPYVNLEEIAAKAAEAAFAKVTAEKKTKEDAEAREKERARMAEERKAKEAEERKVRERTEAEQRAKEAEERKARERAEAEQKAKEAEEQRVREKAEAEQKAKEEARLAVEAKIKADIEARAKGKYLKAINNNYFGNVSEDPKGAFYKMFYEDANTASAQFEFCGNSERALRNPDATIFKFCDFEGNLNNAETIINVKPGILINRDGYWTVSQKAQIKLV
ncbi:MAG: hypothetical protein LBC85_00935 [Fibromonadaceae bacterium]|nr:hypothetical protein [Fibromonadaceae bacterium]